MTDFEYCVYRRAIERYGDDNQSRQCIEEMAELIQALSKVQRYGRTKETMEALHEELADVSIMLDQMAIIYGFDKSIRQEKTIRLARKLREEESN